MSDWGWVTFAYATVYLTLAVYTLSLVRRQRTFTRSDSNR
jgi:hypothetical protein